MNLLKKRKDKYHVEFCLDLKNLRKWPLFFTFLRLLLVKLSFESELAEASESWFCCVLPSDAGAVSGLWFRYWDPLLVLAALGLPNVDPVVCDLLIELSAYSLFDRPLLHVAKVELRSLLCFCLYCWRAGIDSLVRVRDLIGSSCGDDELSEFTDILSVCCWLVWTADFLSKGGRFLSGMLEPSWFEPDEELSGSSTSL